MAKQQTRYKRDPDQEVASHEQELAEYLQERIKPGLNRGAIPLLARSIAKEIVDREHRNGGSDAEAGDEHDEEAGDASVSPAEEFEAEMHELQTDLGEDWIVRFSVQGDRAWLTAEKEDGSQHVEAPTAQVLAEAVELLEEEGGRSD
jgi:hypothetical protein